MHVGVVFSQTDSGRDADAIRAWALAAGDAGFHHLMACDHVLGARPGTAHAQHLAAVIAVLDEVLSITG